MRAVSYNPTAASLMGVNNNVVISFTFGLGSALAAAAGIFYSLLYQAIDPFMGLLPGINANVLAIHGLNASAANYDFFLGLPVCLVQDKGPTGTNPGHKCVPLGLLDAAEIRRPEEHGFERSITKPVLWEIFG